MLTSISYLGKKEQELLVFLLENHLYEFTPIAVSKQIGVTNKTVINRCAKLVNNGFVVPLIVNQRITSYRLSEFTCTNELTLLEQIK